MRPMLLVFLLAGLAPNVVHAAAHTVEACMDVVDTRPDSPTFQTDLPLAGVEVHVQALSDNWGWMTVADDVTDATGCFVASTSEWWIDDDELYRVLFELDGPLLRVRTSGGNYTGVSPMLVAGGDGDTVGPHFFTWGDGPSEGAALTWVGAHEVIDRYGATLGQTWAYQKLEFTWPSNGEVSGYWNNRISLTPDAPLTLSTIAHEMAHHIAGEDATGSFAPNYCAGMGNGPWPQVDEPYLSIDASYLGQTEGCVHSFETYEHVAEATSEAHAEFVAAVLVPEDVAWELGESHRLNFDSRHREGNQAGVFLDLWDTGHEEATWLHSWLDEGSMTELGVPVRNWAQDSDVDGTTAWLRDGGAVYRVDLQSGATALTLPTAAQQGGLTAHAGVVCLLSNGIQCQSGGGGNATLVAGPPNAVFLRDLELTPWGLFALGRRTIVGDDAVWWQAPDSTWQLLMSWPVSADRATSLAVSTADHRLFVARDRAVYDCPLFSCGTPTTLAGSGQWGTDRGYSPSFTEIGHLALGGTGLFVTDEIGVARIELAGLVPHTEQFAGIKWDNVYENRISPRALDFDWGEHFAAIGDTLSLVGGRVARYELDRLGLYGADVSYAVDMAQPPHEELYCGEEDVSIDVSSLFHAYSGIPRDSRLSALLNNIPGLSASDRRDVEEMNWIRLRTDCEPPWDPIPAVFDPDDIFLAPDGFADEPVAVFDPNAGFAAPPPPLGDDPMGPDGSPCGPIGSEPPPEGPSGPDAPTCGPATGPLTPERLATLGPDLCQTGEIDCTVVPLMNEFADDLEIPPMPSSICGTPPMEDEPDDEGPGHFVSLGEMPPE